MLGMLLEGIFRFGHNTFNEIVFDNRASFAASEEGSGRVKIDSHLKG